MGSVKIFQTGFDWKFLGKVWLKNFWAAINISKYEMIKIFQQDP